MSSNNNDKPKMVSRSQTETEKSSNDFLPTKAESNTNVFTEPAMAYLETLQLNSDRQTERCSLNLPARSIVLNPNFPDGMSNQSSVQNVSPPSIWMDHLRSRYLSAIVHGIPYPNYVNPLLHAYQGQLEFASNQDHHHHQSSPLTGTVASGAATFFESGITGGSSNFNSANGPSITRNLLSQNNEDDSNKEPVTSFACIQGNQEHTSATSQTFQNLSKPKRPLTAYNFFFKEQRAQLLKDRKRRKRGDMDSRLGFEELAKTISGLWKTINLELKEKFNSMAEMEKKRYRFEMEAYNKKKFQNLAKAQQALEKTVSKTALEQYLAGEGKQSRRKPSSGEGK